MRQDQDPGRWQHIKAVFLGALDRPESDRAEYLASACAGDDALHGEVLALLASDAAAGADFEVPATELLAGTSDGDPAPRLSVGDRLGPYEIGDVVGAGGMGEVYRARDTRLGRVVAIKIVGALQSEAVAGRRLLREARHASTLKHPNICTVHEIAEDRGIPYIVMELVEGRPLREFRRTGVPGAAAAVTYGIQIADALDHAHRQGIVHRDLKSTNIVIDTNDRAILLDFGLSRRLPQANAATADSSVTEPYALAGTLSYMAPEVLLGAAADARSDIWALGVLLYEMAAGRLPFDGQTPFETSAAIIRAVPAALPRNVPLALRAVIERCLARDPAGRYQHASEVRDALEAISRRRAVAIVGRWLLPGRRRIGQAAAVVAVLALLGAAAVAVVTRVRHASGPPAVPTIAVVPLANTTGDPGLQYLADGLTDSLVTQLGALGSVRVISRTSADRAAASGGSAADIGRRLGASVVAQGAVQPTPKGLRMEMRLTDVRTGRALWSDEFERAGGEVLVLEADVVRSIAASLEATLQPRVRQRLAMVRTVDPRAYEAYLRGRFEWNRRTRDSLQAAVQYYTTSLALDPTYAPAYAALADCYNQQATVLLGGGPPAEYRSRAAAQAIRALQIDAESAEAHAALGYVRHYEWQWDEAAREFERAIELNPSYALARLWHANLLMSLGRFDEAIREASAARDLDPFSLITNSNVGWVLYHAGRPREAVADLSRTIALDRDYPQAHFRIAGPLAAIGDIDAAIDHANRFVELTRRSPSSLTLLGMLLARKGRTAESRALLSEYLELARRQYVPPTTPAGLYLALGDVDAALTALERGYDDGSNQIAYLADDPAFASILSHPRYQALLVRAGLRR